MKIAIKDPAILKGEQIYERAVYKLDTAYDFPKI